MAITKEVNIVVKEIGLDTIQKQVNKLDSSLENLSDTQAGLAKSMQNSSNSVLENGGAMGLLNDATGGLAMTVKDAVEASVLFTKSEKAKSIITAISTTVIGTSTGAMKLFRIALASTGIGLIVIGLGLLIANFDKIKKAVLNLVPGLAQVGEFIVGIVEIITDFIGVTSEAERALASLTEQADKSLAMNKKFLAEEGDLVNKYTKAKIDAKNAYNEAIKEEGANQIKLAARLNRELLAIDKMHNEDLAKTRKEKQDKIDDENKKLSEKQKAINDKKLEDEKKRIEDEAKIKLDAQMDSAKNAIAILDELKKNLETPAQKEQREFEEKKAVLEANNLSSEELEVQHIEAMFAISNEERKKKEEAQKDKEAKDKEAADKEIATAQAVADAKLAIQNGTLDTVSAGIGLLKTLGEKSKAVQKATLIAENAAGIAKTIINTVAANAKSVAASPLTAGQPWVALNTVSAGIGIASSIAATAKGLSALGGGSAGSSSTPIGGGSAPSAPSFNLVQGTGSNQVAQSIGKQQPIQSFVVSREVTTAAELDRNIVKSASL